MKQPQEVHIAYQNSSTIVLLAKARGMYDEAFSKDKIDVKYDLFLSGPPMLEAFAGGHADLANTGDMPPVSGKAAGIDVKIVGRAGYLPEGNALIIPKGKTYQSVTELKGKKIAVKIGSSAHHYLILLLRKNGLDSSDVNIVNLPATEHKAALERGDVDAVASWEPWTSVLLNSGEGKLMSDSSDGTKRYVSVFIARNEFAKRNPDIVKTFLKVNAEAAKFMQEHPEEALDLIAKESKLERSTLDTLVRKTDWNNQITNADVDAFESAKLFLAEQKVLKNDFDIKDLFDLQYLKSISK